jgi:hypothetical protein
MGETGNPRFVPVKLQGRDKLEDIVIDGRTILKCVFNRYYMKLCTGFK